MKGVKFTELQNQDTKQLEKQIAENRARLTALEFQKATGHLENHSQISTLRRDIARMKTAITTKTASAKPSSMKPAPVKSAPVKTAAVKTAQATK